MMRWILAPVLLLCLVGCGSDEPTVVSPISPITTTTELSLPPLPTLDPDEIARGQVVYEIYCASCHGADLEGEEDWMLPREDGSFRAPPHDATGHTWHHGDRVLVESVKLGGQRIPAGLGQSNMPPFADLLTDDDITAVLTYIKSYWPEEIQMMQWEMSMRDRE